MGYGHERAAYGLKDLAHGGIIAANDYRGIPDGDRASWKETRTLYELISRLQPVPLIGQKIFALMDYFQRVPSFYPRRDLSQPTTQLKEIYHLIERKQLGKDLIQRLSKNPLPMICTFFTPAFAAEVHGYPGDIYCVVCDADMSRAWVGRDPGRSRIKYFAPNGRVVERLKLYGVSAERIFLTGFPLPKENIGGPEASIVKKDVLARLHNLDPQGIFYDKYASVLEHHFGASMCHLKKNHPLTLTFCVGGAGAQRSIGTDVLRSLKEKILRQEIRVNIEAGVRQDAALYFHKHIRALRLGKALERNLFVHVYDTRSRYFQRFALTARSTDILWTKPSELSFYTGLGLPIIIAPPIGSQEDFNKMWLETVNGGIAQLDPVYTNEWLFDWINSGGLARFAWSGYIEAPTHGAYRIESIVTGKKFSLASPPLIV